MALSAQTLDRMKHRLGSGDVANEIKDLVNLSDPTAGTCTASKVAIVDANKDIGDFRNVGITGQIDDANGNELIKMTSTASAVNEFTCVNAATAKAPRFAATGGDTNITVEFRPKGTGMVECTGPLADKRTQTAATDTATLTIADLLTKIIDGTPTAAATYTLPTAANLVAGMIDAKVGDSFNFCVNNKSAGANTITVVAGTGGTADGTLTIAQNVIRDFEIIVTNVTAASEAYFVYGKG